jgi:hypothetical protein
MGPFLWPTMANYVQLEVSVGIIEMAFRTSQGRWLSHWCKIGVNHAQLWLRMVNGLCNQSGCSHMVWWIYSWIQASCTADAVDWYVSATDQISGLFLAGPIGVGPGISGIFGYASMFHLDHDMSRGPYAIGHCHNYIMTQLPSLILQQYESFWLVLIPSFMFQCDLLFDSFTVMIT